MGCAHAKPSQGSPARSGGRGIDHLKRNNGYVPSAARRLTDPLPTTIAVKEQQTTEANADPRPAETEAASETSTLTTAATLSPSPPPSARREPDDCEQLVDGWPTWLLDNVPREALQGIVPRSADAFDKIEKVGQGTYSNVYKARERGGGRVVALKKVRFDTAEPESVRFMAREMRILRRLDHPNIIRLDGIATSRMHRSIYLVFEFMYSDLSRLISRSDVPLTLPQVKCYMQQLLAGLQHCHERGILHRDIKGSNLLIDRRGVLKIGDLGLANYYGPGRRRPLTSRVVTLWYRAPELLLGATDYGVGIDLWSAGCLLAEMFSGKPLMPGRTEVEQLFKIFSLCGSPSDDYWRKTKLPASFRPPKPYKSSMMERFAGFPPSALPLLHTLLALDPAARGTAAQALQSDFFTTAPLPCDVSELPVVYKEETPDPTTSHDGRKPKLRQRSSKRRESKQRADQEQRGDELKISNAKYPNKENEIAMEGTAKSGQELDGIVASIASSRVQESAENAIVNAFASTTPRRFSGSPIQGLLPGASPDQPQLRRANTYHSTGDDHKGGVALAHHSMAIRSAT
ncbi:probable serine/threonine-protein kinase At1g54610 [Lolium rigidum]|uniref:probable serine/threonine-protein kinase At1g54610 n=1 Tax=Lolium rigidum TaxID=89674 RepID=UPI001F5E3262|nr:probable serine/threonine-protein kinase At1g54610 [Lolium rigidum]